MREHARSATEAFDGLRGIAILLVVLFHSWIFSWYTPQLEILGRPLPLETPIRTGYLGVELFFMISGFVLFFPYAGAFLGGRASMGVREFAWRRFLKIVPSYALALGVTALLATGVVNGTPKLLGSVLNHVFFIQNSFNDRLGGVNSVFWSLAVEVQFYLIFPFVAWAFARRPALVAVLMIVAANAYRLGAERCCLQVEPVTRQLPAFLDVFACGMAAAYALVWLRANVRELERFAPLFTLAALAFVAGGFALLASADTQSYVPGGKERWLVGYRTLFAADGAALGLASCLAMTWWRRIIANPVLLFLGLVSYNLYLWHTLVLIWMWKHGVPPAATPNPHDDDHWKVVYIASGWAACLLISVAITYFVERPLLGGATRRPFAFAWPRRWPARPETHTGTSLPSQIQNPR